MVTDLILGHRTRKPSGRLVVLGAGNCNDLYLDRLLDGFTEVHLVDVDAAALAGAVERQRTPADANLHLHGDTDVTNVTPTQMESLQHADVVVSTTMLTQLIDYATETGSTPDELLAIRDKHLRLIANLLTPGGFGILITDVVSSDTCRRLRTTSAQKLGPLLVDSISAGDFFTGANPFAIEQRLTTDPKCRTRRAGVSPPWRWDIADRSYLVCAVAFQRTN